MSSSFIPSILVPVDFKGELSNFTFDFKGTQTAIKRTSESLGYTGWDYGGWLQASYAGTLATVTYSGVETIKSCRVSTKSGALNSSLVKTAIQDTDATIVNDDGNVFSYLYNGNGESPNGGLCFIFEFEVNVPEPTIYNVLNNTIPDHYILAEPDISYNGDTYFTYTEKPVSQLNYVSGDSFPSFALIVEQGYAIADEVTVGIKVDNSVSGTIYSDNWSNGTEPIQYAFIFESTVKMPDAQVGFDEFFPLPVPEQYAIPRTITLDRSFCTADKDDSVVINDGTNYTVSFTADKGYIFKSEPYCRWGLDTVLGTIIDSTHATITLETVDQDLTIVAVCEEESVEPQPQPNTGLAFVRIYNPTFSQLKEAADALFLDLGTGQAINLEQYIISIHKVMIPVPTNELSEPIRFWKYNTGVASKVINQSEVKVTCGKITIPEMWHNALDYTPYTTAKIWLPFMGFFDVSINELMRDEIELTYTIDIISGKALAEVIADGIVVYRFVGTAKIDEPYYVESGRNISQAYINGAYNMADFTPYILLDRPKNLTPSDTHLQGLPTYRIVTIGDCTGFIQCEQVFAVGMTATEEEKEEIESLLKQGVLVD